jgi:hypothetical protein
MPKNDGGTQSRFAPSTVSSGNFGPMNADTPGNNGPMNEVEGGA